MNEVYICDYIRTPIGRYGGSLSSIRADDLAAIPIKALMERNPNLDASNIDEVILGCANQAGEDNRNIARMATLLAGLPISIPGTTINRLCGSGMDAISTSYRAIKSGELELMIAGGAESMSRAPFVLPKADSAYSRNNQIFDTTIGWRFINPEMEAKYSVDSMPETAENVAEEFNISRNDQDVFAYQSQQRASKAFSVGRFQEEITPVQIIHKNKNRITFSKDEYLRPETTLDKLQRLPTPFRENGTVTAGNASGVNDGAAALLIASEKAVEKYNLIPVARIIGSATAGVSPHIMGIGPLPATLKLCEKLNLKPSDFDVIELNEAFASQAIATIRGLGLNETDKHINPNGGAIALGHPLGMSGARISGSLALELKQGSGKLGLASMCIGVGQGIALALEAL